MIAAGVFHLPSFANWMERVLLISARSKTFLIKRCTFECVLDQIGVMPIVNIPSSQHYFLITIFRLAYLQTAPVIKPFFGHTEQSGRLLIQSIVTLILADVLAHILESEGSETIWGAEKGDVAVAFGVAGFGENGEWREFGHLFCRR